MNLTVNARQVKMKYSRMIVKSGININKIPLFRVGQDRMSTL